MLSIRAILLILAAANYQQPAQHFDLIAVDEQTEFFANIADYEPQSVAISEAKYDSIDIEPLPRYAIVTQKYRLSKLATDAIVSHGLGPCMNID